ncbi:MAG: SDR family oxidoreductase, partial [Erysipelotrichaceae bacterium]|nr:SDR family oxidoreductase [Erysipelotrichaceae bacterium]
GVSCLAIKADISDEDQVDGMVSEIEAETGGVDILVNNAAIDMPDLFSNKDAETFRRILDVNVVGAFNCAKRVSKHMIDNRYGRIINISSTNGINTYYPMCLDYDASKAALISLTHDLAVQFAPYVNVNAVAPGFIGTESELEGYDEKFLKQETDKILVGRYGEPEEVADLVAFLVSDEASYINNSVIRIDGGQIGSC